VSCDAIHEIEKMFCGSDYLVNDINRVFARKCVERWLRAIDAVDEKAKEALAPETLHIQPMQQYGKSAIALGLAPFKELNKLTSKQFAKPGGTAAEPLKIEASICPTCKDHECVNTALGSVYAECESCGAVFKIVGISTSYALTDRDALAWAKTNVHADVDHSVIYEVIKLRGGHD